MTSFEGFGLHKTLDQSLASMGFDTPTPIQKNAIPLALEGKDVLGSAQTGTGKTAAFAIPLVNKILNSDDSMALVLTPTRELARQVIDTVHQLLGQKSPVKTAFIIGGESIGKQLDKLRQKPRIIVGTPGRVNDHLRRKSLKLETADMLVLDETDRMLDMGFGVQLDAIIEYMPHERQTLMFSATVPAEIERLSKKYLKNPERIEMGEANQTAENVTHDFMRIDDVAKYDELRVQLECRQGSVIIFMKTKYSTEKLVKKLANDGYTADALHGDLKQSRRDRVLKNFRNNKYRVLVATDVAARGLDIPAVDWIIQFDPPDEPKEYIHRVGRTARGAGTKGRALLFLIPEELGF
ncbi:MAG: ATP-dependent RNA helicase, partial [Alphaproteobacteria bacterium]|nr:ATP-dependent RNA helicase [Alphaproteobacteria bacterium]